MPVVFLTPVGLDGGCWDWLEPMPASVRRHEYPGHGSRAAAAEPFTLASLAEEVATSHQGTLDIVGGSLGGMVAQHVALQFPNRVRSLVLACTGPSANAGAMNRRADDVEREGMAGVLEATLRRWFTTEALDQRPEHPGVAYARRTLTALPAAVFANCWRAIAGHDVRERLNELTMPITCIAGIRDLAAPLSRLQTIVEEAPFAQLVQLDGPHMLHLELPNEFALAVRNHLQAIEG